MKVEAMVHSLKALAPVEIVAKVGDNQYIAKYRNLRCTAIFNPFVGRFYVDDLYGVIGDARQEGGAEE